MKVTPQQEFWKGDFSKGYLKRNLFTPTTLDSFYKKQFGLTRSAMNKAFLAQVPKDARILEVGANYGAQLSMLQKLGFTNLYGIEINPAVADFGRTRVRGINLIEGNALDIPYKDGYFDLAFTSGVLIHIAPKDRARAMQEIYRVSKKYIWGFEYFAPTSTEIMYRGHRSRLWKADFPALYKKEFPKMKLLKEIHYAYTNSENEDVMFLFKK